MALKLDADGVYREYDLIKDKFVDDVPLASSVGQIYHQTAVTSQGNIVDHDDKPSQVVDEQGLAVMSEDEHKIKEFIKEAISVDSLVATFNDNSHETLLKLLALQDNKHPLKKGGIGVAYRTDALIMHCKMEFTADENIVFDAILGTMSSLPENTIYRIEPSSFVKYSKFENENYLYDVFRRGADKLKERHLKFEELGPDGDDDIIVPWFDILRYHKKNKKNDIAFIEFKPSDFFKDLALCSQLVHGAYGSLEVTTQLRGKYTIALYWFLENKKRYKEYPSATEGTFDISIEEFKHQFSIPNKYCKADIERRVLQPAYESINAVNECDFTFEYEGISEGGKHVGYRFKIMSKNYIEAKNVVIEDAEENDQLKNQVTSVLQMSGISFSVDETVQVYGYLKRNSKDVMDLMQILPTFKQRMENKSLEPVEDKVGYICKMLGNDQGTNTGSKKEKEDFSQRDYDYDQLEEMLINKK